ADWRHHVLPGLGACGFLSVQPSKEVLLGYIDSAGVEHLEAPCFPRRPGHLARGSELLATGADECRLVFNPAFPSPHHAIASPFCRLRCAPCLLPFRLLWT